MDKKKAAGYARVSTKNAKQLTSYEHQLEHWKRTIEEDGRYDFVGMYADYGISGKSMDKRRQFQTLIDDALSGKVDMIFASSVSRFARNLKELLDTIHLLRENNVGVYFEKENINSLDTGSDLYLTVAASIAENDLRDERLRILTANDMRTQEGYVSVGNGIYGYAFKKQKFTVIEEEAKVIKIMFKEYLDGKSLGDICKELNDNGYRTRQGGLWSNTTVRKMLSNEKYCGDVQLRKFLKVDGKTVYNQGERISGYIENNHKAIISKEDFVKTQEQLKLRTNPKLVGQGKREYSFTGKIRCGCCGKNFIHKVNNAGTPYKCDIWNCSRKTKQGAKYCQNNSIKDKVLQEKFIECYNEFVENNYESTDIKDIREEYKRLLNIERQYITLKTKGLITDEDYDKEMPEILKQLNAIKTKLNILIKNTITPTDKKPMLKFDEEKVDKFIEKVTIHNWTVTFTFRNGIEISRPYDNGKPGNIRDWVVKNRRKK